ncbi:carbon monoxide dehydrogenase maturation protein [Amycolatopsis sp. OK19-0408]|uniref:Carbon monoxide dehydrogenase maturation protein n=1 Tax=Amycolatopsis iheyensis TaxID=2945988 RepID=A0A9X2SPL1_9PSEU|nr:carbon monoxide dehydrogenase maturation protein [Amycolatopsis iheyensis]MCR6488276.1 carbon monoxide dehydrogenase maturation protein [Amycolatopsis iheyensis]
MLIALCSVHGSPGVTTLAVALAAHWPDTNRPRRLIAEIDPAGGDLAIRLHLPTTPGLASLAAAARRQPRPHVVWDHTQELPGGARVLVAPPGSGHARAALQILAGAAHQLLPAAAREPEAVVLADCGRVDPGTPAEAIARQADTLVLLTGARDEDLAHTAARLSELARWTPRRGLLLAGDGYPTAEVERELGVPTIGRLPHDPAAAATLTGHRPPLTHRRRAGGLARHVAALARSLATPASAAVAPAATAAGQQHTADGIIAQPSHTDPSRGRRPPSAGNLSRGSNPSSPTEPEPRP